MEFKNYDLWDEVEIGSYVFEVRLLTGYFLSGNNCNGDEIFKHLGVEKHSYVKNIVGHEYGGGFPEVNTIEDLNKVIKQLQIDCLIKEAKEKYPIGTRYRPATIDNIGEGIFIVGDDQKVVFNDNGGVYLENPDGYLWNTERNNHIGNQALYYNSKWAEIITEETRQPEINTYGLKVGDKLSKAVLDKWPSIGNNRYQKNESLCWHADNRYFMDDRKIVSFKVIDGIVGFLVSGTNEAYLRAEGFKEFAEGFNKTEPAFEFETGKWYKCEGYNYVIKYLRKEARNSEDIIIYSDIIRSIGEYESFPEGTWGVGYIDGGDWYELTDLSEIQEYLPEEHPDKIKIQPEYIVGKWYRMGAWIAKFKELKGDQFWSSISGTPFDNYKHLTYGSLSIKKHGTPVLITDMTEVYKLFPEEKPIDLELKRWYEEDDFIVYLYARNSVYGFHHDYWFESTGFNEKGLKLCHPQKVDDKLSKYIRNKYQIGNTVTCPYDQQIFKIKELDLNIRMDRVIVPALGVKKKYGFLFYQGKWAEIKSDWKISERELNYPLTPYEVFGTEPPINLPNKEKYYAGTDIVMPDYDKCIKENSPKQESTTELLLKSKNKKQKFVKLTEIKTIKL